MSAKAATVASLRVRSQDGEKTFVLREGENLTVGRDSSNDICPADAGMSRTHAVFSASSSGVILSDRGSTNGTFVNGEPVISMVELADGDIVDIGATKIEIKLQAAAGLSRAQPGSSAESRSRTAQLKSMSVSILVATIADYEKLVGKVPIELVSRTHLSWNQQLCSLVERLGGKVDKLVHDSAICYWLGDDARRTARQACAAMMQLRALAKEFSQHPEWISLSSVPWAVTLVVSSGQALKAAVGPGTSGQATDLVILGDPTRVALKLEELVGRLGVDVIMCQNTADLVGGQIQVQRVIQVKLQAGRSLPVYSLA
jgi:class 3 adenylate cyclase